MPSKPIDRRRSALPIPALRPAALRLAALLAVLCLAACGSPPEDPVGTVSAEPDEFQLPHGHAQEVHLSFTSTAELGSDAEGVVVFVHLLDQDGEVVLTADHPLDAAWTPGEAIDDRFLLYHSALAPALASGDHRLTIGLYRGDQRWALDGGEEVARREYAVAEVRVPIELPGPDFTFSDAWTPPSLGSDRQITARRWLTGAGTVTVAEIPADGRLALEVELPEPSDVRKLVLEEGEDSRRLVIAASCPDSSAEPTTHELTTAGRHRLMIPLAAGPGCELAFEPNHNLVDVQTFKPVVLSLEQLAFVP